MRAIAIALLLGGSLLVWDSAQGATTQRSSVPAAIRVSSGAIQLAGSFHNSNAKGGDKLLSGQAGGRYGIGGSEPKAKYFKNKMKKIPRCCANSP
jgi:hypothetical protein